MYACKWYKYDVQYEIKGLRSRAASSSKHGKSQQLSLSLNLKWWTKVWLDIRYLKYPGAQLASNPRAYTNPVKLMGHITTHHKPHPIGLYNMLHACLISCVHFRGLSKEYQFSIFWFILFYFHFNILGFFEIVDHLLVIQTVQRY